jgi:hypothetical protein
LSNNIVGLKTADSPEISSESESIITEEEEDSTPSEYREDPDPKFFH